MDVKQDMAQKMLCIEQSVNYKDQNLYPKDSFLLNKNAASHIDKFMRRLKEKEQKTNFLKTNDRSAYYHFIQQYENKKISNFVKVIKKFGYEFGVADNQAPDAYAVVKPLYISHSPAIKNTKRKLKHSRQQYFQDLMAQQYRTYALG